MEFSDLIEKRYSVRAYRQDPVDDDTLERVLEAARLAPTAANRQPFQLIVIHTAGREAELKRIYNADWFVSAPLLICACGVPGESWVRHDGKNYNDVDVAIAVDHLILAATEEGLGTCWVAAFNVPAAREALRLPDEVEPVAFTPLGYPADEPGPKMRRAIAKLVRYETW